MGIEKYLFQINHFKFNIYNICARKCKAKRLIVRTGFGGFTLSNDKEISTWFLQYGNDIYHYLMYQLGTTDVEDLVQEVFIKAFTRYELFEGKAKPKTWLFSIARNVLIDELRRRKRHRLKSLLLFKSEIVASPETVPEMAMELSEQQQELYYAIKTLKINYREVLILRGIKELSVSETAAILNWTENKVHSTYYRARKALKDKMGGVLYEIG